MEAKENLVRGHEIRMGDFHFAHCVEECEFMQKYVKEREFT